MKERPALRTKIDALYAGPPGDFVAARNGLAKELKGEGKREEAERVAALKRPTVAAAVLNRLARERPEEMKAFAKAAAQLRKASGKKLREAARAERDAAAALVDAADAILAEEEGVGSAATRDKVIETIQAAAADPGLEELLVAGRLDKERSIASVGFALEGGGEEGDEDAPGDGEGDDGEDAAERRRRERELKAAEKRVHGAKAALKKAGEAKKRTAQALGDAEAAFEKARDADRAAAAKVVEAEHELQGQEAALNDL